MNSDAGTEDFFWREMNEREEREAFEELMRQQEENKQRFLDDIRKREQRRTWKNGK